MNSNERRGLLRCRCSALNNTFVLSTERLEEHCERNVMKNGSLEGTEKDCKKSSPEPDKVPEITKSKQVWLPVAPCSGSAKECHCQQPGTDGGGAQVSTPHGWSLLQINSERVRTIAFS